MIFGILFRIFVLDDDVQDLPLFTRNRTTGAYTVSTLPVQWISGNAQNGVLEITFGGKKYKLTYENYKIMGVA